MCEPNWSQISGQAPSGAVDAARRSIGRVSVSPASKADPDAPGGAASDSAPPSGCGPRAVAIGPLVAWSSAT